MKDTLSPALRFRLNQVSVQGDPLKVKAVVLESEPSLREEVCAWLLTRMYEGHIKDGGHTSHLAGIKVLFEDPRIRFQPSRALMEQLAARAYQHADLVRYLTAGDILSEPLGVCGGGGVRGPLTVACARWDIDTVRFLLQDPCVVRKATRKQKEAVLEHFFGDGEFGFWRLNDIKFKSQNPNACLNERMEGAILVLNCLLDTAPQISLDVSYMAYLLNLSRQPNASRPYGCAFLAQRPEFDLVGLLKELLSLEGAQTRKAQQHCEGFYQLFPEKTLECLLSCESLYEKIEETFCPTLYKGLQKHILLRHTRGLGVPATKPKM